jgi:hypothetical protein
LFQKSGPAVSFASLQTQVNAAALAYAQSKLATFGSARCIKNPATDALRAIWLCLGEDVGSVDSIFTAPRNFSGTGVAKCTWAIEGPLPGGISFKDNGNGTAELTGTATELGVFDFTVKALSASGDTYSTIKVTVSVLGFITTTPLPAGIVGSDYYLQLQANGGVPPYTFTMYISVPGSLPNGLSMISSGIISGKPVDAGTSQFALVVTDSVGQQCTQTVTITVAGGCPQLLTTFNSGLTCSMISASKDAGIGRVIISNAAGNGALFNTVGNLLIAPLDFPGGSASYIPTTQKFCFGLGFSIPPGFTLVSALTGLRQAPIGNYLNSLCVTSWSADDNGTYSVGLDYISTFHNYICRLGALTETVDFNKDIGISPGGGPSVCLYVPTPKSLVFDAYTGPASLDQFSLPGGAFLKTINLDPPGLGFGAFYHGLVYATNTGKIYCSASSPLSVGSTFVIYEIDPTSFTILFTYNTLIPISGAWSYLEYDAAKGLIYAIVDTKLLVINPTTRTILCSITTAPGGFDQMAFDSKSGHIFTSPLSVTTVGVYG